MLGRPGTYPRPVQRRRSPVRIRRCPATAMPRLGDESGRPFCAETNVSPRRKGGSGGPGRRASSSADAEVFVSGQTIDSRPGRSPRRGEAAALGGRPRAAFALAWSGGKDSALVLWTLRRRLLEPEALITTVTASYGRISMHGVRRELLARPAEALGVPLVEVVIPPSCVNEIYEARMAEAFASEPLSGVEAVAFGDLFLADVRAYREGRLAAAGKRGLFPLWGHDTATLAHEFLDAGFEAPLVWVAPRALDPAC